MKGAHKTCESGFLGSRNCCAITHGPKYHIGLSIHRRTTISISNCNQVSDTSTNITDPRVWGEIANTRVPSQDF